MRNEIVRPFITVLRSACGITANGDSGSDFGGSTQVGSSGDSIRAGNDRLVGGINLQLLYHILRVIYMLSYDENDTQRGKEIEE